MTEVEGNDTFSLGDRVAAALLLLLGVGIAASCVGRWVTVRVANDLPYTVSVGGGTYARVVEGLGCGVALFAIIALAIRRSVSGTGTLLLSATTVAVIVLGRLNLGSAATQIYRNSNVNAQAASSSDYVVSFASSSIVPLLLAISTMSVAGFVLYAHLVRKDTSDGTLSARGLLSEMLVQRSDATATDEQ